jgi:hypothetical protein
MPESSSSSVLSTVSRFKLLERPLAIPGKCVTCGAVDRPVIDTGWNIDYYGVVYFCTFCLTEVATVIGMVDGKLLRKAEADSARSFRDYLVSHKLRVISNEQYFSWVDTISSLHNDIIIDERVEYVPTDKETASTEPTADENIRRTAKQEPYVIVDEGPISVSDGSVDGDKLFNF